MREDCFVISFADAIHFDLPGIQTEATTKDILEAVREFRERLSGQYAED